MGLKKNDVGVRWGNLKEIYQLEDLDVDGR
jgi:hypothetical protein